MARARKCVRNSTLALSKSEQSMQGTLAKLRHLSGRPRGWFLTLCRRKVILYLTPTFPADDECEEVRRAAGRTLAIQLDVQETRVAVSVIIKELVLQTHAGIDICSVQLPHAFTSRTPRKKALLKHSLLVADKGFCHASSQEKIQKRRASNKEIDSRSSLENKTLRPRDAGQVGTTLSPRNPSRTPLPVEDGCRLPVSSAASDRADDHTVVEPTGAALHVARISSSASVAEFSSSRVCVRGTHVEEDASGTQLSFVLFLFLKRDEGGPQPIILSGSYLRTMVTQPKHLRWRVRQQLQSSESEMELLRC